MVIKKTFRGEIFLYFILVFVVFTAAILFFQYEREKKYRISQLENTLDNITEITHQFIEQNNLVEENAIDRVNEIVKIIPHYNTRITVIGKTGAVLFDSSVEDFNGMENHMSRPEIQKSIAHGRGANIRRSATTLEEYYYYARNYDGYFIRTAVIYDVEIKNFLKAERAFLVFIIILFSIIGVILFFVTGRLAESITKLKNFAVKAGKNERIEQDITFPDNELGIIGRQIISIYNHLKRTKDELSAEKEKLLNHLNALNEGVAFFSPEKEMTLANSPFIRYINILSKEPVHSPADILKNNGFRKLDRFLDEHLAAGKPKETDPLPQTEFVLSRGEKYYKIESIIFADRSFELMISDITRLEKRRLLKQQLTSNIAHELKTPLASIKGYLETMIGNPAIPAEKQTHFLKKAYSQSERLTHLINDVSLLNNIEDAGELFQFKPTDIKKIIADVYENFANRMDEKNIGFDDGVKTAALINGNGALLFSIFQNLVENSINYAGQNTEIAIRIYHEDDKYYYFSFSDTGAGIPEEHLPRIFERFYRVDYGRTREAGGTGLGLAIVKNAVHLHKGEISVRNRPGGGVEFLFSLSKK